MDDIRSIEIRLRKMLKVCVLKIETGRLKIKLGPTVQTRNSSPSLRRRILEYLKINTFIRDLGLLIEPGVLTTQTNKSLLNSD